MGKEKELTAAVDLCLNNGHLNPQAIGWSRTPLHTCNLSGRWPRKKRWNYWAITSKTHLFSATISNIDYVGLVFVYLADFTKDTFHETTKIIPFGRGCDMPEVVNADINYSTSDMRVKIAQVNECLELKVDIENFEGKSLSAFFCINQPDGHESLNVVIPWDERTFQFTSKQNTLPTEGNIILGDESIQFNGDQSFACLDFGRGIWPRKSTWNWGSASGTLNGRTVGLNLGGQWTDGTGYTENALCINGRLSKISEALNWQYDRNNFYSPWHITAPSGCVDLTFHPMMERVAKSDLFLVKSEVHQMFGYYQGTVVTDQQETITLEKLLGWAEDHAAKW